MDDLDFEDLDDIIDDLVAFDEYVDDIEMEGNEMAELKGPQQLKLTNHGGRCCGVKHLHEFPYSPDHNVAAYKGGQKDGGNGYTQMIQPGKAFRYVKYPAQTGLERLKAVLAECKLKQPQGLVEVILPLSTALRWQDHLLELGFEKGPRFVNSNTYMVLQVYYLVNK